MVLPWWLLVSWGAVVMSLFSMSSLWEERWKDGRLGGGGQLEAIAVKSCCWWWVTDSAGEMLRWAAGLVGPSYGPEVRRRPG